MSTQRKRKILNGGLVITSLLGYLQWGSDQRAFLAEAEWEVLTKLWTDPLSVVHPFVIIPMVGQLILVFTLFESTPSQVLTYVGMIALAVLLLFLFLAGILSGNVLTVVSIFPFLCCSGMVVAHERAVKRI